MIDVRSTIHRRGFLGRIAAGAAALGITSMTAPFRLAAEPNSPPKLSPDSDLESWLGKITGKHRQVFDAPSTHEGMPFIWSWVFLTTNNGSGTPDNDQCAVVILRHDAIPAAMEDRLWAKYNFGEVFKVTDKATKAPAVRNPFWNAKEGDFPLPDMAMDKIQKRGVLFGVCDMALTVYSGQVAKKMNMDAAEVKKDWVAGILPGIQIVPSGVLAINRVQERGCTYCFAG